MPAPLPPDQARRPGLIRPGAACSGAQHLRTGLHDQPAHCDGGSHLSAARGRWRRCCTRYGAGGW